uniref:Uncharacterized protein n=1 Tax=Anguilla anguilla TaxID=7936 RepID=A0A0E9U0T4_ANGAN
MGQCSFAHTGAQEWNELPLTIKQGLDLYSFKVNVGKWLLEKVQE